MTIGRFGKVSAFTEVLRSLGDVIDLSLLYSRPNAAHELDVLWAWTRSSKMSGNEININRSSFQISCQFHTKRSKTTAQSSGMRVSLRFNLEIMLLIILGAQRVQ